MKSKKSVLCLLVFTFIFSSVFSHGNKDIEEKEVENKTVGKNHFLLMVKKPENITL